MGINIEPDDRSLAVAGDAPQILFIFQRIERFIGKIAGKEILNFDTARTDQSISDSINEKTSNARRGNKPNQKKSILSLFHSF